MIGNPRRIALYSCFILPLALFASPQAPDNTKANKDNLPTADQQKETKADRELAAKIRKSVMADKSLSTYAHNVKIIVQNGVVTLKGPVKSDQESQAIQAKAQQFTEASSIRNEITVAPPKAN
jgi:hyperosmotically inducible periplasmic protein